MPETDLDLTTVVYPKHKYACHLEIGEKRIQDGQLKDQTGVMVSMTKWIARCVREQPVVTGTARVEVLRDFLSGRFMLRAWAYAFKDVDPIDQDCLQTLVDRPESQAAQIPRLEQWTPTL